MTNIFKLFRRITSPTKKPDFASGFMLFLLFAQIPFLFAENAATVFLHVVAGFTGALLAFAEVGAEVAVEEGDVVLLGFSLGNFPDEVVFLVGADEERG